MKVDMISVGPNTFPCHNGKALAWDPGIYMTWNEASMGYPKAMTVLRALRDYRPNRFDLMRVETLKNSVQDAMFGHNAAKLLNLIEIVKNEDVSHE